MEELGNMIWEVFGLLPSVWAYMLRVVGAVMVKHWLLTLGLATFILLAIFADKLKAKATH